MTIFFLILIMPGCSTMIQKKKKKEMCVCSLKDIAQEATAQHWPFLQGAVNTGLTKVLPGNLQSFLD